jgi:hypothetical protein
MILFKFEDINYFYFMFLFVLLLLVTHPESRLYFRVITQIKQRLINKS